MQHFPFEISEDQRANLLLLAALLLDRQAMTKRGLEHDMIGFNMGVFDIEVGPDNGGFLKNSLVLVDKDPCGTVACACGWGPIATGEDKDAHESWTSYSERTFGCSDDKNFRLNRFLFSGAWPSHDNRPEGAAKRILYALDHGVPERPENPDDDDFGGWWDPTLYDPEFIAPGQ